MSSTSIFRKKCTKRCRDHLKPLRHFRARGVVICEGTLCLLTTLLKIVSTFRDGFLDILLQVRPRAFDLLFPLSHLIPPILWSQKD